MKTKPSTCIERLGRCYVEDTKDEVKIVECQLHGAASLMLKALKEVPDPSEEGYCPVPNCNVKLVPFTTPHGRFDKLQHEAHCWYGQVQAAITAAGG